MPSAAQPPEFERLFVGLRALLLECAAADRSLRERGHTHALTRIHGHFEFSVRQTQHQRFAFGLVKGPAKVYAATLDVDFELRPVLAKPPIEAPVWLRALPSIIGPGAAPERSILKLRDGRTLAFGPDGLDGALTSEELFAVLETLAAGFEADDRHDRTGGTQTGETLIDEIVVELSRLLVEHASDEQYDDPEAPWAITSLQLALRARIDPQGTLADPEHDPEASTYCLVARVDLRGDSTLVIDQRPGDLRSTAEDVAPFLAKLREHGRAPLCRRLIEHLASTPEHEQQLAQHINHDSIEAFLDDAQLEHVLLMTLRDSQLETLVYLAGPLAQRRVRVVLTIPHEIEETIRRRDVARLAVVSASYEALALDVHEQVSSDSPARRYVDQVLGTLARWQREGVPA